MSLFVSLDLVSSYWRFSLSISRFWLSVYNRVKTIELLHRGAKGVVDSFPFLCNVSGYIGLCLMSLGQPFALEDILISYLMKYTFLNAVLGTMQGEIRMEILISQHSGFHFSSVLHLCFQLYLCPQVSENGLCVHVCVCRSIWVDGSLPEQSGEWELKARYAVYGL